MATKYTPGAPRTNEDLLRDLLTCTPQRGVSHAFVLYAIHSYAKRIAATPVEALKVDYLDPAEWHACAQHIKTTMDNFCGYPVLDFWARLTKEGEEK